MKKNNNLKILLMAAGVILSAAFYLLSPNGAASAGRGADYESNESEFGAVNGEGGIEAQLSQGAFLGAAVYGTYDPSGQDASGALGYDAFGGEGAGFTKRQKDELREIVENVMDEKLAEASGEAVRNALKAELAQMLETGKLTEAVVQYARVQEELVNINTAGAEELKSLNGIGDAKAAAVIEYREKTGGFGSPDEIVNVDGISTKLLEKIRDRITV